MHERTAEAKLDVDLEGGFPMVKNNRTNEQDLREAVKENARLAKEEVAKSRVLEHEEEEREHEDEKKIPD